MPVHAAGAAPSIPLAFDDHSSEWNVVPVGACVLCAPGLALNGVGHDFFVCLALHQQGCAGAYGSSNGTGW
jgi:hypothetical protein